MSIKEFNIQTSKIQLNVCVLESYLHSLCNLTCLTSRVPDPDCSDLAVVTVSCTSTPDRSVFSARISDKEKYFHVKGLELLVKLIKLSMVFCKTDLVLI